MLSEKHGRSSEKARAVGNRSREDFGDESNYAREKAINGKSKSSKDNAADADSDSFYASDNTERKRPQLASGDTTPIRLPKPDLLPELNSKAFIHYSSVA